MPRASTGVDIKGDSWTYGCEHEFSDWNARRRLIPGYARSPDYTIVNSNSIAAHPNIGVYWYGGEINTPPTEDTVGQVYCLESLKNHLDKIAINHRSNLHCHIRVPGLKNSLPMLKRVQEYIHRELPKVIDIIEPIPKGTNEAERRREKRRKVSHHTFLTEKRLQHQLAATTVQEFFEREVPKSKAGAVMWHAQPRLAVGLRQLLQTDTVEFRHFPGTLASNELLCCLEWCRNFMLYAIRGLPIQALINGYFLDFPKFPAYNYELEVGYQATAHNIVPAKEIPKNIALILKGEFRGSAAEREAQERAGSLSR